MRIKEEGTKGGGKTSEVEANEKWFEYSCKVVLRQEKCTILFMTSVSPALLCTATATADSEPFVLLLNKAMNGTRILTGADSGHNLISERFRKRLSGHFFPSAGETDAIQKSHSLLNFKCLRQ